jgi:hypothetical protein
VAGPEVDEGEPVHDAEAAGVGEAFREFGPSVLNDIHKVNIKKMQRLLRHQTQTTTEIYLKKIDDDLAEGMRLLEKWDPLRDTPKKRG